MATFKAVVQKHQQRRDGKFPVSIRVTHNRKSFYLPTGLYCSQSQINKKTFEIKDQFIIARVVKLIMDYERRAQSANSTNLSTLSAEELKNILLLTPTSIDYLGYCRELAASNPKKKSALCSALGIIENMGIKEMSVTDFNSSFLHRFKEYLDTTTLPVRKNGRIIGRKPYAQNTKKGYLQALCHVFRLLQRKYNTEFNTVISHNPFFNLEMYQRGITAKRSMSAKQIRSFFSLKARTKSEQETIDMMRLSFCLCGVNMIDILSFEKSALVLDGGRLSITYERHKTKGRKMSNTATSVRIEPEITDIIRKYRAPKDSKYLFKFGKLQPNYNSTLSISHRVSRMCDANGLGHITPYWFRHTWATIARNECDVSKDDIDLCLAHSGNNPMADVYIRPDWSRIDRANRKVLDYVFVEQ